MSPDAAPGTPQNSAALSKSLAVTFFANYAATRKRQETLPLTELVTRIERATAQRKADLPWLKLARFGNAKTDKGSLRHDSNVLAVTGVEADYDAGRVAFGDAEEKLTKAGILAILYTSPSHHPDKPRWRVLCPTSAELPAARRAHLVGRLNGLFRGIFADESFTLSQSYYYGSVQCSPAHRVVLIDGTPIDLVDELDETWIGKPDTKPPNGGGNEERLNPSALLQAIREGKNYHRAMVRLAGSYAVTGMPMLRCRQIILEAMDSVSSADRDERYHQRRSDLDRCLQDIYGKELEKPGPGADDDKPPPDDFHEPEWPAPLGLIAFPGIVGEFISTLMPHTEADAAALLFQFLAAFGNMIGLGPHYQVESDEHPARLFVVLVGATAKGRKGTSIGRVRALLKLVDADWDKTRVASGLSTGEGLIYQVRDERLGNNDEGEEIVLDMGVDDKRFLAISSEFAGVLRIMARVGNSLSSIIRDAWDRSTLRTLTKTEPLLATGAHISQIGHVTADELRRYLDATETANGFANRYLFVCVKRARLLPDGGGEIDWNPLTEQLKEIVETARSTSRLQMDGDARTLWHNVYGELSEARPGLLGAVVARAEAQVIRIALIYALLDRSPVIGVPHLQAAFECWRYAEQSARYVFGDALGDPIADSILAALRQASDGLTRTQISEVFGRHVDANKLARGLQALQRAGLATPEERPTAGRPAIVWRPVKRSA